MDRTGERARWTDVGAVADIPRLGSRVVTTSKGNIAVFRNDRDEVFALEDRCPHKGGPLSQGIVHGTSVTCPLHNWVIDLESGQAKAPDRGCATPVPLKTEGGRVLLDLGPFGPVRTTCPYCGVGCGVVVAPDGRVQGDPDHPANAGQLCSKGSALAERLNHAERLQRPRVGGREADWDTALDLVATRFADTVATHGPDSVALYVSGQMLTEDYYVANKLMKGFIGSANIDTNSRLCMASSVAGHVRAFGEDVVPGGYADWDEADLVVLVGSNAAWCHPVLFQRLEAAKAARGTRVVTIDPRRTATSAIADLHLAIAPGADVALFAGLLVHLAAAGTLDRSWIDGHTNGFAEALTAARRDLVAIDDVATATGLPRADIETFYDWFTATERVVTVYSQGVNQSSVGTDKVNAIINCHLATGRIGRPGMGPFSVTGQPNAMGGREVGGLANQLAAHMDFDPDDIDRVRRFWGAPRIATRPGHKAIDMIEAVRDGRIKALWIIATNPADSMPRADRVREALAHCPFVVVSDCWDTDTTRLAHVVLPAMTWGEKDGTVTNSERCIARQRAFRAAPGEARADWSILAEVARRMGWADGFAYHSPADIFREHAALSAFENDGRRVFDIGALAALTDDAYEALAPVRWPLPAAPGRAADAPFAGGRFPTRDGRARFVATPGRAAAPPSDDYPFWLNTGRIRDQWHTMTRTGRSARLMSHMGAPFAAMHPLTADAAAIGSGDLVRLETPHGSTVLPAHVSEDQPEGSVFVPMHWTDQFTSAGPIDRLVGNRCDPVSGQPELKLTPLALAPVPTHWHGVLVRRDDAPLAGPFYWHRLPMDGAHVFELVGTSTFPVGQDLADLVDRLLARSAAARLIESADAARRSHGCAALVAGRVESCLVLADTADGALRDRSDLAALVGSSLRDAKDLASALGRPSAQPRGARQTVCSCHGVELETIRRAVASGGITTVGEIGTLLRAGTNCGSCIPELRAILREAMVA